MHGGDHTFVRISWHSKPKIVESSLYFAKWGRSSVQSNRMLNKLLSCYTGFETEIIKTGNAGEHALTLDLAMQLEYATGYAVESYHFINIFEKFSGILANDDSGDMSLRVKIAQIESRNPHLHQHKGDDHVEAMIAASLSTVYHTQLCPPGLRGEIDQVLVARGYQGEGDTVKPMRVYPALSKLNLDTFTSVMEEIMPQCLGVGSRPMLKTAVPIPLPDVKAG
jgi:mannosyl-3-phosphoglycerate synthase